MGLRHIVLSMNTRKWISLQDKHRAEHDIPITLAKLKTPNRSESDNIVKKPTRESYSDTNEESLSSCYDLLKWNIFRLIIVPIQG